MDSIREDFREIINEIIDSMNEEDIRELFEYTNEESQEEHSISELIAIKGEIKKLTKSVHTLKVDSDEVELKSEAHSLINFYEFISSSKESLDTMPEITHFGLGKFRESFYSFKKGIEDIELLYKDVMERFSLLSMAKVGDSFDPEIHQAIESEEMKNRRDGEILEIFEQGYRYKDKTISYAKVKVNKNK